MSSVSAYIAAVVAILGWFAGAAQAQLFTGPGHAVACSGGVGARDTHGPTQREAGSPRPASTPPRTPVPSGERHPGFSNQDDKVLNRLPMIKP